MEPNDDYIRFTAVRDLHNNIWTEHLMGECCREIYDRMLTPTERIIVGNRVEGYVNGEIAMQLGTEISTIERHITNIKKKYRTLGTDRVDNIPELAKRRGFNVRRTYKKGRKESS